MEIVDDWIQVTHDEVAFKRNLPVDHLAMMNQLVKGLMRAVCGMVTVAGRQ